MKTRTFLFIILIFPALCSCQAEKINTQYPPNIGDIEFNPDTDKKDFHLCFRNYIIQYFNYTNGLQYNGEKAEIEKIFFKQYQNQNIPGENGLVRIRFVVNCKGETDRFRMMGMDWNYNSKTFSSKVTDQLMQISRNLNGWIPRKFKGRDVDYYQYLIFKIENGNLLEIMP